MKQKLPACGCHRCLLRAGYRPRFNVTIGDVVLGVVIALAISGALAGYLVTLP